MQYFHSVLITGASSGIGAALARALARPEVFLALTGRDGVRLAGVAETCRLQGARVETATLDVTDADALARWIEAVDNRHPLDLIVANAGISAGTGGGSESAAQTRRILAVNVDGVINAAMPAVPRMLARGRGTIALMSSLASFRGFAGAPAYCGSKAMVRVWGEGLRAELIGHGVRVCVICPGYIRTPMTDVNEFPMPLLMSAERAARIILRGLARGKARIAFPWRIYALVRLLAALPPGPVDRLMGRLPKKV